MPVQNIEKIILQAIPKHSDNLIPYLVKKTRTSRQNIYRYLQRLITKGKIVKTGHTRGTQYFLAEGKQFSFRYQLKNKLSEHTIWQKDIAPQLRHIPYNVFEICRYGFAEMCNNVLDHSQSKNLFCAVSLGHGKVYIVLQDNGIGIFQNIKSALKIDSLREAMLHLTKGKFTTDPQRHTGEGIFFTS